MTNKKTTKKALIFSALSLLLCFSMLVGTTFAWFTDSVTSANNIIQSGTLDVTMEWADGTGAVPAVDSADWKDASKEPIFNNKLWEPGYTEVRHVKIQNEGTLALKYEIVIEPVGTVEELADVIDVYFVDPAAQVKDRTDLANAKYVGTLTEVLANMKALTSASLEAGDNDTVTIALKMQETAGNDYQGKKIGDSFAIKLLATQMTYEEDSFDDQYDKDAIHYDTLVTTADELYAAVNAASGSTVIAVDGNIVLTKALSKAGLESIKFVAWDDEATIDQATYNMHFSGAKVTFEGLNLTHGEKNYGDGGQTSTAFAVWHAKEVNYVDCTFARSVGTIHAPMHNFIRCTFNGVENPNNTKSEYPLYICDGQDYNVIDCTFNCTNRGAILFYNDGGSGVDTLNISGTKFLGDIIADKTAVEIHNNSKSQVYNVNINDVSVGEGIINGLYRIKPANVGEVNVTVNGVADAVSTAENLAAILMGNEKNISVELSADIDLPIGSLGQITGGSGEYKLGGADTESIVIDLNGHKLNITTTYWSNLGAVNSDATITVKNGTMTSSQPTGTWNSYDLTFSNCNYVFENVVFDKAVALANTGKSVSIKDVTINETHDYYALWICAEGQNVTIDGLTVNSNGRGIKIDEQYSNEAVAKVTLKVSNAEFNTAKKAAIMVKSAAGADITIENVDISGVAADSTNTVWVDADASAFADKVTVTGGSVIVEP